MSSIETVNLILVMHWFAAISLCIWWWSECSSYYSGGHRWTTWSSSGCQAKDWHLQLLLVVTLPGCCCCCWRELLSASFWTTSPRFCCSYSFLVFGASLETGTGRCGRRALARQRNGTLRLASATICLRWAPALRYGHHAMAL